MFRKGDIIRVSIARGLGMGPEHYGIYDGDGGVFHFDKDGLDGEGCVEHTSLEDFEQEGEAFKDTSYNREYSRDEVIERAESELGDDFGGYDLKSNNCEHFAVWCFTGKRKSRQTYNVNPEDDDRDIVEKGIDAIGDPLLRLGDIIDKFLGLGDYKDR